MTSLVDELTKKQPLKFQVNQIDNRYDTNFISKTISENKEGIFNLDSSIDSWSAERLAEYLKKGNSNYKFELSYAVTNYEIMFQKKDKEVKN